MRFHPPKFDFRREQQAEREIGATDVAAGTGRALVIAFVVTLLAVPATDLFLAWRGGRPTALSGAADLAAAPARGFRSAGDGLWARISGANEAFKERAKSFEDDLKNGSVLARALLPPVQYWGARLLGLGNEQVYLGRGGWLYYRPDFDYAAGGPFLSAAELRAKKIARVAEPDPRPAILQLHRDLAARGIRLIVVPAPTKTSIDAQHLAGEGAQNASYGALLDDLRREGIGVVDASEVLLREKGRTGEPQFLRTDSHWTPQAMRRVAQEVARSLPPAVSPRTFVAGAVLAVTNSGDLTRMLRLPDGQELFPPEATEVVPVLDEGGGAWQPGGEVLLLGDSFANVYSSADLRWGTGAGLAEHLSLASGRGVDRIALNAGGASAARAALARDPGRLDGKTAVVYEFAARDLASGDWKVLPLPTSAPAKAAANRAGKISGTLRELTRAPAPGTSPYRDVIVCMHVATPQGDRLVFCYGMKDNVPTAANRLSPGDRIEADTVPWEDVEERLGSICRQELGGTAADIPDVYWAEEVPARQP